MADTTEKPEPQRRLDNARDGLWKTDEHTSTKGQRRWSHSSSWGCFFLLLLLTVGFVATLLDNQTVTILMDTEGIFTDQGTSNDIVVEQSDLFDSGDSPLKSNRHPEDDADDTWSGAEELGRLLGSNNYRNNQKPPYPKKYGRGPGPTRKSKYASHGTDYTYNNRYSNPYYTSYVNDDDYYKETTDVYYQKPKARISDVWLCLLCALGWAVWLVTMQQDEEQNKYQLYETDDAQRVQGHVLQVSVGQDPNGTDMPIFRAVVDYQIRPSQSEQPHFTESMDPCDGLNVSSKSINVCGDQSEQEQGSHDSSRADPIQIRKCFQTRTLLQEGFLNVDLLVLSSDPTMSILLDDYLTQVAKRRSTKSSPSSWWFQTFMPTTVAVALIITSYVGAFHSIVRLPDEIIIYGWISVILSGVLLVPAALFIQGIVAKCYRLAEPLTERPGEIIHVAAKRATSRFRRRNGASSGPPPIPSLNDKPMPSSLNGLHVNTNTSMLNHPGAGLSFSPTGNNNIDLWSSSALQYPSSYGDRGLSPTGNFNFRSISRTSSDGSDVGSRRHYKIHLPLESQSSSVSSLSSHRSDANQRSATADFFGFFQALSKSMDPEAEDDNKQQMEGLASSRFLDTTAMPLKEEESEKSRYLDDVQEENDTVPQIELAATRSFDHTDIVIGSSNHAASKEMHEIV